MANFACIGDSQTEFLSIGAMAPTQNWTQVLAQEYQARTAKASKSRGLGVGGDTSTLVLARLDGMLQWETPDIAVIHIGVNDPGNSITQSQTQANLQAMIKALKFGAAGMGIYGPSSSPSGVVGAGQGGPCSVAGQANLPFAGTPGARFVVLNDTSTSGGAAANLTGQAATIAGSLAADTNSQKQSVWEYRNPLAGEAGWGRVATLASTPDHVSKIVVCSTNYLNYTTGGDTPATPYATYATVRAAQQAAVTTEEGGHAGNVIYADLYNWQRNRIVGGTLYGVTAAAQTDPNFSADTSIVPTVAYSQPLSWHYTQNNQHHNIYGHWLNAQAIHYAIANAGW